MLKVGRLDLNSEGLLLLTNDGELARALELPSSGWVRRYRARALGHTTQARLDTLKDGTTVDGVIYGPIEATLDKMQEKADGPRQCLDHGRHHRRQEPRSAQGAGIDRA
ncbi:MAG: pseudouridine synthase [Asticcacaulis sp.]